MSTPSYTNLSGGFGVKKSTDSPIGDFFKRFAENFGKAYTTHQTGLGGGGAIANPYRLETGLQRPADRMADGFGTGLTRPGGASRPGGVRGFIDSRNPPVVKDADYYLQQAAALLPGIDFSGLRDRASTSVSDADARVKAMYRAMRDIQAEEAANREASRTAAGEAISTSAEQAASDIQQGYDNAISALANEMAALGIGETLAQEPAQRVAQDAGRQQAISRQLGQISGNLNRELGQSESAFNQQIRDVTGLEGVNFRSQLQNDLLNRLAQLDMAEQQQNQDLALQRLNYAQGLRGFEQSFEPQQMSVEDTLAMQRFSADQARADRDYYRQIVEMFLNPDGSNYDEATQLANRFLQQQGLLPATG